MSHMNAPPSETGAVRTDRPSISESVAVQWQSNYSEFLPRDAL